MRSHRSLLMALLAAAILASVPLKSLGGNWVPQAITQFEEINFVTPLGEAGSTSHPVNGGSAQVVATVSYDVAAEAKIRYQFTRTYNWVGGGSPTTLTYYVGGGISGSRQWGTEAGFAASSLSTPALSDSTGLANSYTGSGTVTRYANTSGDGTTTTAFANSVTTNGQSGWTAESHVNFTP